MVCFDLESLLNNVPIEGAVQAVLRKLESGADLADRTTLTPDQITDLLNFVLRSSTSNATDQSVYEQRDSVATGSPVSAVIANLYIEIFEQH